MDLRNPCLSCYLKNKDKRNDTCMNCTKRIAYVNALCPNSSVLPLELTDLAAKRDNKMKHFTKEEIQFLSDNYKKMTHKEMAIKLNRSVPTIATKLSSLGLLKFKKKEPKMSEDKVVPIREPNLDPKRYLIVDFKGHEHLRERLQYLAKIHIRTEELQLLYCIKTFPVYGKEVFKDETEQKETSGNTTNGTTKFDGKGNEIS